MLKLSFNQTRTELMVRAAATILFNSLRRNGVNECDIAELTEHPQYGFTARAAAEPIGPKFVRITDLQDGKIDWNNVPFCECLEPTKYLLRDNDILFARTGATTGKTHLVRDPEGSIFASYLIRLRPKRSVEAGYLYAFFQSENYWSQIAEEKGGSAQPNVNGDKLTRLKIPLVERSLQRAIAEFLICVRQRQDDLRVELPDLPRPLSEQRRIVARIEELAAKINDARGLRQQAAKEAEAFVTSFHAKLAGTRMKKLDDILRLDEDLVAVTPTGSYPQVGIKSFGAGLFAKSAVTGSDTTYKTFNRLYEGALILSQVKGWEGAVAICPATLAGWFVSPEYRTFRCVADQARPGYLAPLVRTRWFWEKLGRATRGVGARRERTRPEQFLNIEIPIPTIEKQAIGERLFARVNGLKKLQAETDAKLDALFPSIIDQALKGDLR
jgi:type I restriction enzyme, S subunit